MSAQLTMGPKEYTLQQAVVRDTPRLYNRGHRTPSALSPSDSVVHVATPGVETKICGTPASDLSRIHSLKPVPKRTNVKVIMPGKETINRVIVFNNDKCVSEFSRKSKFKFKA